MDALTIFRAGTHTDGGGNTHTYTDDDLQRIAAIYDPAVHEAPLTIGHPADDAPAWGWVERLEARDGQLLAFPHQVDGDFQQMVRNGRFKKLSASFYGPNSPRNPKPGGFSLRHVAFLGAQPPAIKGLPDAYFATQDEGDFIYYMEIDMTDDENRRREAEMQARELDLKKKEAQFAEQEIALDKLARGLRRQRISVDVEALVREGKLLPKHKEEVAAFMESLPDGEVLDFGETTGKKTMTDWFKGFLAERPKIGPTYGEKVKDGGPYTANGAGPTVAGRTADPERMELHQRALAYAEQHNVDYATAAQRVGA